MVPTYNRLKLKLPPVQVSVTPTVTVPLTVVLGAGDVMVTVHDGV